MIQTTIRLVTQVRPAVHGTPRIQNVAAYARVSLEKDSMLPSFLAQVDYYSHLIGKQPDWKFAGVYADKALTGTKAARPEFQRLLADCRAGKIDMVITKSISRFARNTVTLLEAVRELKALGIDVYFEEQNIHSLSADGELMLTILASYAQEESRSVSENCKWRIRRDFENGIPTPTRLNGYRIRDGELCVVPEEAETVRTIFGLYLEGYGKNAITRRLNGMGIPALNGGLWNDSAIGSILRNEKYQGDLLLQKQFTVDHLGKKARPNRGELPQVFVMDDHEAIVSREAFEATQEIIRERAAQFTYEKDPHKSYPFTRKLFCDGCGRCYKRRVNNGKRAWQCSTYMSFGKAYCAAKQVHEEILECEAAAALGLAEFDASVFAERVESIRVCSGNRLEFVFRDGHTQERIWEDPTRRDSWTDEMRRQAAEKTRKRRER